MKYKYTRNQIFGKRLDVPKEVLEKIYSKSLPLDDYIKYDLEGKIPTKCLGSNVEMLVNKFGVDKCKQLDFDMIDNFNIFSYIDKIDPNVEDLNRELANLIMNDYMPRRLLFMNSFTEKMRKDYQEFFVEDSNLGEDEKRCFYFDILSVKDIIINWESLKDKDIEKSLKKNHYNNNSLSKSNLEILIKDNPDFFNLLALNEDDSVIFQMIDKLSAYQDKNQIIREYALNILKKGNLSNDVYKRVFNIIPIDEYLNMYEGREQTMKFLKALPNEEYLYSCGIPMKEIFDKSAFKPISEYGLKNIVDFTYNCSDIFIKDDYKLLKEMYMSYMNYGGTKVEPYILDKYTKEGWMPYTKEEFYEVLRRMIIYGPEENQYRTVDINIDYRDIKGDFREIENDIFFDDNVPEDLKEKYYKREITLEYLKNNNQYLDILSNKYIRQIFIHHCVTMTDENGNTQSEELYNILTHHIDNKAVFSFFLDNIDLIKTTLANDNKYVAPVIINQNDTVNDIKIKMLNSLEKIISLNSKPYPNDLPEEYKSLKPSLFLSAGVSKEYEQALYNREINPDYIKNHPDILNYMGIINPSIIFGIINVKVDEEKEDFYDFYSKKFEKKELFDFMIKYGNYITGKPGINYLSFKSTNTKEEIINIVEQRIYDNISQGKSNYDEMIPNTFKEKHKNLFLPENAPEELKNKFYTRAMKIEDFNDDTELMNYFKDVNIIYGFSPDLLWIESLFSNKNNEASNLYKLKTISQYLAINDDILRNVFKKFVLENPEIDNYDKIETLYVILSKLEYSNSGEMRKFKYSIASSLLKTDNPLENLDKVEKVFVKNNIPTVGKIYACFDILHPDVTGFDFSSPNSKISPFLKSKSTNGKKVTILSDLLKASLGSNNRSINNYINNIKVSTELYNKIKSNEITYDSLPENMKKELQTYSMHLQTLYSKSLKGKNDTELSLLNNPIDNIDLLYSKLSPGTDVYNIGDRIISMFAHFAGIDTIEEAQKYITSKKENADRRNREAASKPIDIKKRDFLKGIGGSSYLSATLQNGSVSKEYLGESAGSDLTPLDTDISVIEENGTMKEMIHSTAASEYGPIWFIIKNDDRFVETRNQDNIVSNVNNSDKLEYFYTGVCGKGHYGIRTGFASSDINYIIVSDYSKDIGLDIALNGFYIPVYNTEEKLVFSPNDYDKLREKMSGLKYYDENTYHFSDNLVFPEINSVVESIKENAVETNNKRSTIIKVIQAAVQEMDLQLKTELSNDLTPGFVEIIDTGSTGRNTNKPGDGDFDFMIKVDKNIISSRYKMDKLKNYILKHLGIESTSEVTPSGDFRLKSVELGDIVADIDITFTEKTDKINYSTDASLKDRLETIKSQDPVKYNYVIANILLAKKVLKEGGVYKPYRSDPNQSGLGGVGIENWILQNGGSFVDAASSFLKCSCDKNYEEFAKEYEIWDFGENHLAERRLKYPHDNFVVNNMKENGYNKMKEVLMQYLQTQQIENDNKKTI